MRIVPPTWPPVFNDLAKKSRYKAAFGGRGSGKSHFFAEALVRNHLSAPGLRSVCVREVQKSLKDSAKRLIEDKIASLRVGSQFNIQESRIVTPGGGIIIFQGMQDHTSESIKSLEGFTISWVEEAQTLSERSLELLKPTIRAPGSELWFSWNPRHQTDPVDKYFRGLYPPPAALIKHVNYDSNPFFPGELETERLHDQVANRDRYGHIWEGQYEPVAVGAIWNRETLNACRVATIPQMSRILVAVDPAVSSTEGADEHGIIVVGLGADGHGYVLDDLTLRGNPRQWADRAIAAYDQYDADAIVIEVNQGGDMCRSTIDSVRPGVRVISVRASRGKHVRAEPIAAQYSMGRVHHTRTFNDLEDQLCRFTNSGYEGRGSPDRADALVWGLTELLRDMSNYRHILRDDEGFSRYDQHPGGWML
ncbi:MAG: PBSX family phage terminase large subunit [Magnetococcus sp. THC-1_WYH]